MKLCCQFRLMAVKFSIYKEVDTYYFGLLFVFCSTFGQHTNWSTYCVSQCCSFVLLPKVLFFPLKFTWILKLT